LTSVTPPETARLPLWRLIAAILVLAGMAAILLALAPVYFEDYQLRQYIRTLAQGPDAATMPDDALRAAVLGRARQLDLPVRPGDIQVSHAAGKLRLQMKYAVQIDSPVYQVDLHFHSSAVSP
jgi:hypothetical protein